MPAKLLNIFALSALALLVCSFAPSQTFAVAVQGNHRLARHAPNHHGIAKKKKKRDNCKPRSSSSYPPTSTPASQPNNTPAQGGYNNPSSSNTPSSTPPSLTTSSTSPPATSPTNTPSTTGSGKLAIAWALGDDPRVRILLASPRVRIFHMWSAVIPQSVKDSGLPVSIMLWNTDAQHVADFVNLAQPGYATHAYGMNEVNEVTQGYTPVPDAIKAWFSYIRPLADKGYTLGSPCTTSAPDGFDWVTDFFNQCGSDCHVDEVPLHWYDVKFEDLQAYVEKWADAFKKPVRLTEFACQNFNGPVQPTMDEVWAFTLQAIAWLESYDPCESYAPFGFMDDLYNVNMNNELFTTDGLTALGWLYLNGHP